MKGNSSSSAENVKVVVRCRPMSEKETASGSSRIIEMDVPRGVVDVRSSKLLATDPPKSFTYDAVYDWNSKQQELYDETFRPLIDSVLLGFNGTIFAYGQTGTGKTFTMEGKKEDPEQKGVIPNSFDHIFSHIARTTNQQFLIRASYLEIYQEEIRDLLVKGDKRHLELKERPDTGVYVKDLQQFVCKSITEIQHVMHVGNKNRSVGATNMNLHSSRSHAIFIVTVESSELGSDGAQHIKAGKMNLVDLAGSERQAKTGSSGERLKEATKINLSLSALGNVISALVDGKSSHIPYRDSKLTRLLQDSLGGNSKTIMVANIGPASSNYDETITTLRYASRAKKIANKPKINQDPKDAILREYQEDIAKLKNQLNQRLTKKKKKKKPKDVQQTEEIEEEATEEMDLKKEQEDLEIEKQRILNDKHMIGEDKGRLLAELNEKQSLVSSKLVEHQNLAKQVEELESRLLSGGKNITDHTNEQQRELEAQRAQLAEQKRREREMLQLLEKEEESTCEIASTFTSLQQEVEVKTAKLKKMFSRLQAVKQETVDLQDEFSKDRIDMQQTQEDLTKELKLKALIIENFIPPEEKAKLLNRAYFDEEEECWRLRELIAGTNCSSNILKRPVSSSSTRRPVSEYAKTQAALHHNPRFKGENIMLLDLDPPARTTRDWEGPEVAPQVAAALQAALVPLGEEEISIDASFGKNLRSVKGARVAAKVRSRTSSRRTVASRQPTAGENNQTPYFPRSRGLVPK